jgi:hypothetical protein
MDEVGDTNCLGLQTFRFAGCKTAVRPERDIELATANIGSLCSNLDVPRCE